MVASLDDSNHVIHSPTPDASELVNEDANLGKIAEIFVQEIIDRATEGQAFNGNPCQTLPDSTPFSLPVTTKAAGKLTTFDASAKSFVPKSLANSYDTVPEFQPSEFSLDPLASDLYPSLKTFSQRIEGMPKDSSGCRRIFNSLALEGGGYMSRAVFAKPKYFSHIQPKVLAEKPQTFHMAPTYGSNRAKTRKDSSEGVLRGPACPYISTNQSHRGLNRSAPEFLPSFRHAMNFRTGGRSGNFSSAAANAEESRALNSSLSQRMQL